MVHRDFEHASGKKELLKEILRLHCQLAEELKRVETEEDSDTLEMLAETMSTIGDLMVQIDEMDMTTLEVEELEIESLLVRIQEVHRQNQDAAREIFGKLAGKLQHLRKVRQSGAYFKSKNSPGAFLLDKNL